MKEHEFLELCKGVNAIKGAGRIVAGFFILESDETPGIIPPTQKQLNQIRKQTEEIKELVAQATDLTKDLVELRKQPEQDAPSQPDTEQNTEQK